MKTSIAFYLSAIPNLNIKIYNIITSIVTFYGDETCSLILTGERRLKMQVLRFSR